MKSFRVIAAVAAVAALGAVVAPSAHAADNLVVVFTAGAHVDQEVWAPGFGDDAATTYLFDTEKPGLGGNFCIASHSTSGTDEDCDLRSSGSFGPVLGRPGLGATCFYSTGKGIVDVVRVNGINVVAGKNVKVEWPAAAGTILPYVLSIGKHATDGGTVVGQGAVQVTGAEPGTCGLDGEATTDFAVTGYAVGRL